MRKDLAVLALAATVMFGAHGGSHRPRCVDSTDPHQDICEVQGHPGHCMWTRTVITQQPGQKPVVHHRGDPAPCDE